MVDFIIYIVFSALSLSSKIDSQVKLDIFTYIQEWAVFGLYNSKILCTFTRSQTGLDSKIALAGDGGESQLESLTHPSRTENITHS